MRELLHPTSQPLYKSSARSAYWRLLALTFRFGKVPFSQLLGRLEPRAPWPGHHDHWDSLEAYAKWLPGHVRWKPDRLGGVIDAFPTRQTIAAQFKEKGVFEEDCDGLAYFSAQNLPQFVDDPNKITIVTVILDPYTFDKHALLYAAHVLLVFQYQGKWRAISNDTLYSETFDSFAEAIQFNPYCKNHPVLWVEVRDKDLHRYASGKNLSKVEAKMQEVWKKKQQMPYIA